jgi:3-hydroxyisobutyrate dehydrogenase
MTEKATVVVLGSGIMGAAVARNLLKAGMEVRVWNRSHDKAEPLGENGAKIADSLTEAARGAGFLVTMLSDADVVAEVVREDVLSALAKGAVWLQLSTVGVEGNKQLAEIAAENGVAYVDAPVLGTKQPAEQGQLVVLASGPEEVREQCDPIFAAIGSRTLWLGAAGVASRLKLVTNAWIAGLLGALAETVAFAEAVGVEPELFFEAIEGGPLDAPFARMKGKMMIEKDFATSFTLRLARKDAGLMIEAAEANGQRLKIIEAVKARYEEAIAAGHGEEDMAAVYRAVAADPS